ncbi:MAG: hypothetical protein Q8S16_08385, partial [Polaromonas sp.]|nr:hypothetical protein [Polaromonas sp.]
MGLFDFFRLILRRQHSAPHDEGSAFSEAVAALPRNGNSLFGGSQSQFGVAQVLMALGNASPYLCLKLN